MAQHINLTDSLADSLANMHRDNVEQFEAKLQEIFDLNKPTFVEQHTYKQMLNDFTLYKAYNMMYEIVEKVEKFRLNTDILDNNSAVFITIESGRPKVESPKRVRTMKEIINFFHNTIENSKLADISIYTKFTNGYFDTNIIRFIDCSFELFYSIFDMITKLKKKYKFEDAINIRLGDTESFEWYGI